MSFLEKGKNLSFLRLACMALACFFTLSLVAMHSAQAADSLNCLQRCHATAPQDPIDPRDPPNVSLFNVAGHGSFYFYDSSGILRTVDCIDCHNINLVSKNHKDGGQTYSFDQAYYAPDQSGVAYAEGYMLKSMGEDDPDTPYNESVPLMIPFRAPTMRKKEFRLCWDCHEVSMILDNKPRDGISTNFKTSLPDPPYRYSYGSWQENNGHRTHLIDLNGPFADSDWDFSTTGPGAPMSGMDSKITCTTCHNVHGAAGTEGSTNEPMIRDGSLVGRAGYGFSYVVGDESTYPMVTSTGATRSTSVGAIFRNRVSDLFSRNSMCFGCHFNTPPPAASYDASSGSLYLEYYRSLTIYSASYYTQEGPDVPVYDSVTDTQITFSQVGEGGGETSIETSLTNPFEDLYANFKVKGLYLNVHTDANISGDITICLNYRKLGINNVDNLTLLHYEDSKWVIVPSVIDEVNTTICGTVHSLSWFVLAMEICDLGSIGDQLQQIIDENRKTPLSDKLEDALARVQTAQDELDKTPPDNKAAIGNIKGAVGDIGTAVKDGLLDITEGIQLMDQLTCIARQLAVDAISKAEADPNSDQGEIYDAKSYLIEGDYLRVLGQLGDIDIFKVAVGKYKDALSKAESALP